jgi:signal transduction histidine kinase
VLTSILIYFPAIIGLFLIGLFVLLNNPSGIKNRVFFAFNVFGGLWILSQFIASNTVDPTSTLWAFRSVLFFGQMAPLMFYYLALVFPSAQNIHKNRQIIFGSVYSLIALLSFTSLNVAAVEIIDNGVLPTETGILYDLSDLLSVLVVVLGIVILIRKLKRAANINEKKQIKAMILGISIVVIGAVTSGIVLLRIFKSDSWGLLLDIYSIVIFSSIIAYSMVKHQTFEIRSIVSRAVAHVLSLTTLIAIYASILLIGTQNIEAVQKSAFLNSALTFLGAIIVAFSYNPLKRSFNQLTNKYFYQDAYEPQNLLNDLNTSLISIIRIDDILKDTSLLIEHYLKPAYILFIATSRRTQKQQLFNSGVSDKLRVSSILEVASKFPPSVTSGQDDQKLDRDTYNKSAINSIGLVVKMSSTKVDEGFDGAIILGTKKSGSIYGKQDSRVMNIIADELVIAIENALRFEEIQQFNVTLQKKVDAATKELKSANEKLIALDQTKDDFISMASHQLRTPLTAIKGYVSMVIEGDVGKITKQQHKLLDQAFLSSQRMVYLIADLLNVSRLKTGKFIIETKPSNLADLVEGELQQLTETIKAKKLDLVYKKPKDFPLLMLDDTKIRQVIMNFADNAIYYTPEGGKIDIIVEDKGDTVEFRVEDNGIGVPKSEQHNLFGKFYRAGNARKARPDGTGLGLFMAKKVVIAQGGALIFKSEENKGSIFGFTFSKSKLKPPAHLAEETKTKKS